MRALTVYVEAVGVALVVAACALDKGGLASGDDAGATDATTDDGGGGSGGDAGDAAQDDAPTGVACAARTPQPTFCDDFDLPGARIVPPWDNQSTALASIGLTIAVSSSPPASVQLLEQPAVTACGSAATITKTLAAPFTDALAAFDFLDPRGGDGVVVTIGIPTAYQVSVSFGQPGNRYTYVQQENNLFDYFDWSLPTGKWVRIAVELSLPPQSGAPNGVLIVSVDGAVVRTTSLAGQVSTLPQTEVSLSIGDNCHFTDVTRELYYDDVTFDTHM